MVRNYQRKLPDHQRYTEADLVNAVNDVLNKNKTFRQAQQAYNVPIAVIYNRIKGRQNPVAILSTGRRPALPADVEETVANCLIARARMGWPSDEKELCGLISEYVTLKGFKTPFKNNIPGHDWFLGFMKRHRHLSFKKPEHLQKIRKDARDPFVVYDFYEKLQDLITEKSIDYPNKSCFVFNADESGFSSDPSRVRAIGEKGKALSRVSGGSGRESTTVLACVAADGSYLPPFIVFKGGAVQARWTSEKAFPGTLYGASKNGWMEEPHFYHWFVTLFVSKVKALRLKHNLLEQTAILLFDGHCSHVSVRIVKSALKHNIELFRFPSHLTDRIQPLDKCVFGPVKNKWDRILVAHGKAEMGKSSGRLSKQKFVELLSQVWKEGITSANILSGFETTGIFPVNSAMFCEDFFDPLKLEKYKKSKQSVSLGVQCSPELKVPVPGTSRIKQNDAHGTFPNETLHVQKHSPNRILHIFSQQLQEASTSTASEILSNPPAKKVVPQLRQSTYGEVLTTPEILKKLEEAELKRKDKANTVRKPGSVDKSKEKNNKAKRAIQFSPSDTQNGGDPILMEECESDDDNLPLSTFINKISSKKMNSVAYREVKWDDIQVDTFILAKFTSLGRSSVEYKYVCVVQQKDEDDGDIAIVGLKSVDETCSDFYINELTPSYITINEVHAILPNPGTKFVGRRIVYSFPGKVDIFEKH